MRTASSRGWRPSRGSVAFVLTSVAVAIPCGAWFVSGSRQAEQVVLEAERDVRETAERQGRAIAGQLAGRLEALRAAESRRPFYHYQNLFHDPQGASEGAAVTVSPLARGSLDPSVRAHFQVDEEGVLTLPTVNEDFPELGLGEAAHCEIQWELAEVAGYCQSGLVERVATSGSEGTPSDLLWSTMSYRAWAQNRRANAIFGDLKYGATADDPDPVPEATARDVLLQIGVGELEWATFPVGSAPGLVALRRVETPLGTWYQGLVVETERLLEAAPDADFPVMLGPGAEAPGGRPGGATEHVVPVGPTGWSVVLDVSGALAAAERTASVARSRFLRRFAVGVAGASLAGLAVVLLVVQADRLARQRSRFAAAAAHELRTPLAGLRLHSEMLAHGLGDPSRAGDYARRIASEVERLSRVVTNVLGFTRLERGGIRTRPQPGDLASVVAATVERHRPLLEQAGMSVELRLAAELPPVFLDEDATAQIVANLIDNAEKHTRREGPRTVRVEVRPDGVGVALEVADDGPGIPAAIRKRLFRPFARGGADPSTEGIGLGLALVRNLAEGQGARVEARAASEGGAAFVVLFRRAEPAPGGVPDVGAMAPGG